MLEVSVISCFDCL